MKEFFLQIRFTCLKGKLRPRKIKMKKRMNVLCLITLLFMMAFTAVGQTTQETSAAKSNPMKKSDIVKALESNAISSKELAERINRRGVDFELNEKSEQELNNAGAGQEVIEAVRAGFQAAPKKKGMFGKLSDGVGKAATKAKETMSTVPASKEQESSTEKHQSENETPVSKNNRTPVQDKTNGAVACSASSEDSEGKTTNEKTFRGVIRRLWEKEAEEGSDGAITITFQNFVIGAPRAWRATLSDAYSQADPKKPIYPVRTAFATCTDYKKAVSKRTMERIYDCFYHKAGGWQCTQTGESGALATKDKKEYIQKQQ
jgi:hypothetical protein